MASDNKPSPPSRVKRGADGDRDSKPRTDRDQKKEPRPYDDRERSPPRSSRSYYNRGRSPLRSSGSYYDLDKPSRVSSLSYDDRDSSDQGSSLIYDDQVSSPRGYIDTYRPSPTYDHHDDSSHWSDLQSPPLYRSHGPPRSYPQTTAGPKNRRFDNRDPKIRVSKAKQPSRIFERKILMKRKILESYAETGTAVSELRPTDMVHPASVYHPGLIFSAPMHTQATPEEVDLDEVNMTATTFGTVYSKYRKMVIVSVSKEGDSCLALPIYSNNGNGIKFKRAKDEWMAIRDEAEQPAEPSESKHDLLFALRDESFYSPTFISGKSNIHLTETVTHNFRNAMTVEGRLARGMLPYLCKVVRQLNLERLDSWKDGFSSETC